MVRHTKQQQQQQHRALLGVFQRKAMQRRKQKKINRTETEKVAGIERKTTTKTRRFG